MSGADSVKTLWLNDGVAHLNEQFPIICLLLLANN